MLLQTEILHTGNTVGTLCPRTGMRPKMHAFHSVLKCLLLSASCVAAANAAFAQGAPSGMPAPRVAVTDDTQVDLITGTRLDRKLRVAIGDSDAPSLAYDFANKGQATPLGGEVQLHCVSGEYSSCQFSYFAFLLGDRVEYSSAAPGLTDGSFYSSSAGSYVVYDTDGSRWNFAPAQSTNGTGKIGYLTSIVRSDGTKLTYNYSTPVGSFNTLTSVASSDGYQMNIDYSGSTNPSLNNGMIVALTNRRFVNCPATTSACPAAQASSAGIYWSNSASGGRDYIVNGGERFNVSGGQDSIGGWGQNTNPSGNYTRFYTEPTTCSPFVGGDVNTHNDANGVQVGYCLRTKAVLTPLGTWNYTYGPNMAWVQSTDPQGQIVRADVGTNSVAITDKVGKVTQYSYWVRSFAQGYGGKYINAKLSQVASPEGNKEIYTYDSRMNLTSIVKQAKLGSGLANLTWTASYPASCSTTTFATCNKPDYVVDFRGQRTDYTYDPTHGGILTETLPADASGTRAVKRYEYAQFSATYMDMGGTMISGPPIWKLRVARECASIPSCQGTAEETLTTYAYNENLLVKGVEVTSNGQTHRTCYGYDAAGNRIWTTSPRANLATCS